MTFFAFRAYFSREKTRIISNALNKAIPNKEGVKKLRKSFLTPSLLLKGLVKKEAEASKGVP